LRLPDHLGENDRVTSAVASPVSTLLTRSERAAPSMQERAPGKKAIDAVAEMTRPVSSMERWRLPEPPAGAPAARRELR
jgi:hypothetical protein